MGEIVCSQTECVCFLSHSRGGKAHYQNWLDSSELVDVSSNMEIGKTFYTKYVLK